MCLGFRAWGGRLHRRLSFGCLGIIDAFLCDVKRRHLLTEIPRSGVDFIWEFATFMVRGSKDRKPEISSWGPKS